MLSRTGAEDTWSWIDNTTGTTVLHALSHRGNGAASAGAHAYSLDGLHWVQAEQAAYTGRVRLQCGKFRYERFGQFALDPS